MQGDDGQSYVAKVVEPPSHDISVSHARKVRSYQVEAAFYQNAVPALLADEACSTACPVPTPHHVQCTLEDSTGGSMVLVMSDLAPQYPSRHSGFGLPHAKAVLSWLAAFHAQFWAPAARVEGVWEEGCYWHLATRIEELAAIGRGDGSVKNQAFAIAEELRSGPSITLLHGDAKAANFLFNDAVPEEPTCVAYDFQYTGYGDPMKDVVYALSSSTASATVGRHEEELLRHYHTQLTTRLTHEQAEAYSLEYMKERLELAAADYYRFMAGWGFWGNSSWTKAKTDAYLRRAAKRGTK